MRMNGTATFRSKPMNGDVHRGQVLQDADDPRRDDDADRARETAEDDGGQRVHEGAVEHPGRQRELRRDERAGDGAERRGEAPADHEQASDRQSRERRGLRVDRDRPQRQAELRADEEPLQQRPSPRRSRAWSRSSGC